MIVVKVELWSAINGSKKEIARMMLHNTGGTHTLGNYSGEIYKGRSKDVLEKAMINRKPFKKGEVINHPRLSQHVWNLVAKMLNNLNYGK